YHLCSGGQIQCATSVISGVRCKSISSTEVCTKVFALDVAARHRVQFSMPESDAVSMLKRIL
ncbi:TPA: hypothetical protein GF614_22640, partial [Escherichia coli]|nr:hypothetical protein [Escherichia coli]